MKKTNYTQRYFENPAEHLITPAVLLNFFGFTKNTNGYYCLEIADGYRLFVHHEPAEFLPVLEEIHPVTDEAQEVSLPPLTKVHELEYLVNYLCQQTIPVSAANCYPKKTN